MRCHFYLMPSRTASSGGKNNWSWVFIRPMIVIDSTWDFHLSKDMWLDLDLHLLNWYRFKPGPLNLWCVPCHRTSFHPGYKRDRGQNSGRCYIPLSSSMMAALCLPVCMLDVDSEAMGNQEASSTVSLLPCSQQMWFLKRRVCPWWKNF